MTTTRLRMAVTMAVAAAVLAAGCGQAALETDARTARLPRVTASTGMIADAARNVGGDRVRVEALMGPGVDPHLYKPTQGDMGKLSYSDLVLYNGLHLEGKMGDVLENVVRPTRAVRVTEGIPRERLRRPPEFEGEYDPHVWFDVALWKLVVEQIREAFVRFDPDNAEVYRQNAEAYLRQLDELDRYVRDRISELPEDRRVLITAHDAFGYFGDAYGVEVMGLQGISTTSEYGLQDLARLVDAITSRGVKAVFVESSISPRSIEALVRGVEAKGHAVRIGGTLYSDALGEEGGPAGTYVGMVRHNVDTIVEALR